MVVVVAAAAAAALVVAAAMVVVVHQTGEHRICAYLLIRSHLVRVQLGPRARLDKHTGPSVGLHPVVLDPPLRAGPDTHAVPFTAVDLVADYVGVGACAEGDAVAPRLLDHVLLDEPLRVVVQEEAVVRADERVQPKGHLVWRSAGHSSHAYSQSLNVALVPHALTHTYSHLRRRTFVAPDSSVISPRMDTPSVDSGTSMPIDA